LVSFWKIAQNAELVLLLLLLLAASLLLLLLAAAAASLLLLLLRLQVPAHSGHHLMPQPKEPQPLPANLHHFVRAAHRRA